MKKNILLFACLIFSLPSAAATLTWDANGAGAGTGGTGNWDTSSSLWDNGVSTWPASGTDNDAVFGGTAGTVSLTTGITANDLTFNTTGYIVQGNTLTLNGGATPILTTGTGISATISSIIAGTAGLTKAGDGTLTFSGANTYTGGTTVSAGTLNINAVGSGGNNGNAGAGAGTQLTTSALAVSSGALAVLNTGTSFSSANTGTTLSGAGTVRLLSGTWWLGNAGGGTTISMSAGGLIDVQGGTMKNDYANANWSANQGGLNVAANAYFDLRNNNVTVGALTGAGSVYDNGFTNTLTVGAGNAFGTYSGSIGLGGATVVLTKTGTGTQTLTGNNVYSGATTVNGGVLEVAAGGVINNASVFTVGGAAGATLLVNGGSVTATAGGDGMKVGFTAGQSGTVTVSGGTLTVNTAYLSLGDSGTAVFNQTGGTVNVAASGNIVLDNNASGVATMNLSGGVFNQTSGTIQLTQRGSGTVNISGTASVSVPGISMGWTTGSSAGTVNLNGGSLTVGASNIAGGTGTSTFNFNGGTLKAGTSNAAFMQGFTTANVRNSGAIIDTNGFSPTIGQALLHSSISGDNATDGGLIKQGVGTLTLKGANTYTGATAVNGGALSLDYSASDTSKLADGTALILGGGTVSLTGSSSTEVVGSTTLNAGASSVVRAANNNVLQMGAITRNAGGTVNFSADSIATTTTGLTSGLLGPWATVGSGASTRFATKSSNNIVAFTGTAATGINDFVSAAANYEYSLSGGTDTLTANRTANSARYSGTGETVDLGASGTNTLTLNALVNAGSGTLTLARTGGTGSLLAGSSGELLLNAANASIAVSAPISGTGLVVASGAGANTVTLSGANTHSGGTALTSGTLVLGSASALGTGALTITGGALNSSVANLVNTGNNAQNWNGNFTFTGSNALNLGTGTVTLNTTPTVTATANTLTVGGPISGSFGLTLNGTTGSLVLSGTSANTYTGLTSINGTGTTYNQINPLVLSKSPNVAAVPGSITLVNNESSVVYATADNQFGAGSVMTMNGGAGNARFELRGTTQTLAGIANDLTGRGVIQNREVSPVNDGASTLILNGSGSYAFNGYLRNSTGVLALTKTGTGTQTLSGGNITYTGRTQVGQGTLKLLNVTGYVSPTDTASGAVLEFSNTVAGFASRKNSSTTISGAGDLNITGGGWSGVIGTVAMTGQINVSGNSVFHNDNLTANWNGNAAGLYVAAGSEFHSRGQNSTFGALTGAGKVANDNTSAVAIVTVGMGNGSGAFSGTIHGNGTGGADGDLERGVLALVKTGTGTQTLSGASTYTGGTTVRGGNLTLDFAAGGASNILSASSALTLAGGTLEIKGGSGETNTQTFNGLSGTHGTLRLTQNGASSINATLGAITGTGMLNFAGSDATVGALGNLNFLTSTTTTGNNGTTRLGANLWNGTGWASTSSTGGNHLVEWIGSYADIYNGTSPGPVAIPSGTPAAEVRILEATSGFGNNTLGANETINSLLMSAGTTAATVNMGASTLTVGNGAGALGAVAIGSTAKSLTFGTAANQGFLTAGTSAAASALSLNNLNPSSTLTVNSVIKNNAAGGVVSLTSNGAVTLNGVNTFTGATTIQGGTLEIGGAGQLNSGSYSAGITNAGTLRLNSTANQTLTGSLLTTGSGSALLIKDNTGTLTLNPTGDRLKIGLLATDFGNLTVNAGTVTVPNTHVVFGETGGSSAQLTVTGGAFNHTGTGGTFIPNSTGSATAGLTVSGGSYTSPYLYLGQSAGVTGTVTLSGSGTITFGGGSSTIGNNSGTAIWNQSGGTATFSGGETYVANSTGPGTINVSGGSYKLTTDHWFNLGKGTGLATLNVSGSGAFQVVDLLLARDNATSRGIVNLSGGSITVTSPSNFLYIGHVGAGTWNQTGGTATISSPVRIAQSGVASTMNLTGGTFTATSGNWMDVGYGTGLATLNVSGTGYLNVKSFIIGRDIASSKGIVNLGAGGTIAVGTTDPSYFGHGGAATWNQTGGTATFGAQVQVAAIAGSSGVLDISGGTFTANSSWLQLGIGGPATMTVSGSAAVSVGKFLMSNGTNNSTMNMNGGTLTVGTSEASRLSYSSSGNATWNQTAGTATFGTDVWLSGGSGPSTINISGGTFAQTAGVAYLGVGTGQATINLSGTGLVSLNQLQLANSAGVRGTVNLDGGTLRVAGGGVTVGGTPGTGVGTINFNGGTFQAGNNMSVVNNAALTTVINAGGAVMDSNGYTMTFNNPLTGTGSLTKTGAGTVVLNSSNTYAGPTTINAGTLSTASLTNGGMASGIGSAPAAAANLALNGGTLQYTGLSATTNRGFTLGTGTTSSIDVSALNTELAISGDSAATTGALTKTGSGQLTLSGTHNYTGATLVSAGRLNVTGSLASPVTVATGGTLAGLGGSTSGTLALSAGSAITAVAQTAGYGNAFRAAGLVTVGAGTIIRGTDGSSTPGTHNLDVLGYGTTPGIVNFSTASYRSAVLADDATNQKITLSYTTAVRTWNSAASTWDVMNTTAWQEGDQRYADGDAVIFDDTGTGGGGARAVTLNSVALPGSVIFSNLSSAYTLSGTGAISGTSGVVKTGAGTVTLSSANTYSGGTSISGGQVQIRNQNALGAGAVTVGTGGMLAFSPSGMNVLNNITLDGGVLSGGMDGGTIANTYSGTLTLGAGGGTLTTWWSDKTLTIANPISGAGNLTVDLQQAGNNAPNVILTANNSYPGTTTITAGTLEIGNGGATGSAGAGNIVNNGILSFNRTGANTVSNTITGTGAIYVKPGNDLNLSGPVTTNILRFEWGGSRTVTLSGSQANSINSITDNQDGHGTLVFAKTAGVTAFSGAQLDVGSGYASQFLLRLDSSNQIADTTQVNMYGWDNGYGGRSWFRLNGNNETIAGLSGGSSTSYVQNTGASPSVLTLGGSGSYTLRGAVENGGSGTLSLVKNGIGTQTFNGGSISYTGSTTINQGTLGLLNINFNSSSTTLAGGTLDVQGSTVNAAISGTGLVTVAGGSNSNFGGGNKTYSGDTIVSGSLTLLTQTAANSLSGNSIHNLGSGVNLITGNLAGSVKALTGSGGVNLAGTSAHLTLTDGSSQIFSGVITGAGRLTKAGGGTQTLTAANTYTGGTTVTGGLLVGTSTTALGTNSGLTLAGGNFAYQATAPGALNLGSGVLNLANGSRIGTSLGGTLSQSAITSSAAAVANGAITVDLYGISTGTTTTGTHNLISVASGLTATGATFTLGNIYNASSFTVNPGTFGYNNNAVYIQVTSASPLAIEYWKGGYAGSPGVWAVSDGSTTSNWNSNAGGTLATPFTPGPTATAVFSATGSTDKSAMTLGQDMNMTGVVVNDPSGITLNNDSNSLTLGTGGLTVNNGAGTVNLNAILNLGSGGVTATAGAGAVNLAGPITLGAAQAWTNDSGNTLTVSGNVANAGNTLTLGGSGTTAVTSVVSGAGGLGKSGAGTTTLSGANTFTGAVAVNGGILKAGVASVAGVSGAFGNGTAVTMANTSGVTLDITGFNTQIGSLAGGGASGGNVTLGAASLTVAGTANTTYSGVISGSGGSLVKTGSGSLTLAGGESNTYTGGTTLTTGVLGLAKTGGAYAVPGDFIGNNINSPDVFATMDNQFAPGSVMRFTGTGGDHVRFELLGSTQTLAGIDNSLSSGYGVIQHREQVATAAVSSLSTLVLNGTGTYSFNAYLRDSGGRLALSKTGSGTQTLSGTVIDYTGTTTLTGGLLKYVDLDDLHSAGIAMTTGTVVEFSNTARSFDRFTNTVISGDGTFIKSGPGLMTTGNQYGYARWAMTGGTIDVQQGEFRADYQDAGAVLAWGNNKASMNVASGATVSMVGGNHISVDALTGSGTVQNINIWGTGIFTVGQNNGSGTFSGILRDNGGPLALSKKGSGTQTLSGPSTYTGGTTVSDGTLRVDFAAGGTSNILPSSGAVTLAGGTLEFKGGAGENDSQVLNGVTSTANSTLQLTLNGASSLNVTLGAITNNSGSAINFAGATTSMAGVGPATPGTANFITTTTTAGNNGSTRLGANLWNGADWASTAANGGTTYVVKWQGTYTDIYNGTNPGPVAIPGGGADVRILEATSGHASNTLSGATTVGSLLMNAGTTSATVNMGANTLTVGNGVAASGAVAIASSAQSLTFGTVTNQGTLTAGTSGASTLFLNNLSPTSMLTVNSAIANNAGAGAVSLNTSGSVTLAGNNTYTGSTIISSGTLKMQAATLPTGTALSITGVGATFELNGTGQTVGSLTGVEGGTVSLGGVSLTTGGSNASTSFSGVLTGSGGSLVKTGTGTMTLAGNTSNTYTGSTTLSGTGQLILSKTGGAVAIPGDFYMSATGVRAIVSTTQDNQFAAGSVLRFTGTQDTRLELKGTTQTLGGIENTGVTGVYNAIQHSEVGSPSAVDGTSDLILNVLGSNSYSFNTANGALRDQGGLLRLTKTGTGTQIFSGGNVTYSGATTVNQGKLVFQGYYGSGLITIASGAVLELNVASGTQDYATSTLNGAGTLRKTGTGTARWGTQSGTFAFGVGSQIDIQQGSLDAGSNANENWSANRSSLNVESGASIAELTYGPAQFDALTGLGSVVLDSGAGAGPHTLTLGVNNTLAGAFNAAGTATFAGVISQGGSVIKVGTGTQILSGINTYTGGTTVSAGTLVLGHLTNTLPNSGAVTVDGSTAILSIGGNSDTVGLVSLKNGGQINGTGGTLTGSSYAVEKGSASANLGGPGVALTKTTADTVTLSGVNTYSGVTTVSAGVLRLDSANALPGGIGTTDGTSALTFNGGVVGLGEGNFTRDLKTAGTVFGATFTGAGGWAAYEANRIVNLNNDGHQVVWGTADTGLNSQMLILGASTATHTVDFQNALDLGASSRTVRVDDGGAAVDGIFSGALSGSGALNKTGTGTLQITANNTAYTGPVNLSAGTLSLSGPLGTLRGASGVAISGGATLLLNNNPDNNINRLNDSGTVAMTGGTLNFVSGVGSTSETTGALTVSSGANTIHTGEAPFGQTSTLTFASFNMTGGTLAFTGANLGVTDRNRIFFTTPPTPNSGGNIGVGGSNATYGNLGFARYDLTLGVVLAPSDATISVRGGQIPDALTSSIRIDETGSSGDITVELPYTTINTLLQDAISEARVDMAGKILAINTVLVASDRGRMTFGTALNSGTLTSATFGGNIELNNASNSPMTVNAVVADNGGAVTLVKTGTGTLVFAGAGTYTGGTAIQDGILQIAGTDRLPVNTLATLGSGSSSGILQLNGNSQSVGGVIASGTGTGNKVVNGSGTAGNLTLSGSSTTSALLGGTGPNENNFSLTSTGSPTVTGSNTFTGEVTVKPGATLSVPVIAQSGAQPLGQGSSAINLQAKEFFGPATLEYTGTGAGATNRGLSLTGGLGLSGKVTVSDAAGVLTVNGALSGDASFRKAGAGTLVVAGSVPWNADGYVDEGTLVIGSNAGYTSPGSTSLSAGNWTVAANATLKINTTGVLESSTIDNAGAIQLESGTLRLNTLAGTGSFSWGNGTLATAGNNRMGMVDRTAPAGAPSGPVVMEGNILNYTGTLSSSPVLSGKLSILDLGTPLLNDGLRYNQIKLTGTLDLSGADTLNFAINPYLLRPTSPNSVVTGDWGTLILAHADTITGRFDSITGIGNDGIGWTGSVGDTFTIAANLDPNTYYIEYRASGVSLLGEGIQSGAAILFHYKVAGSVPEAGSAGLVMAGVILLRALRRRK